MSFMKTDFRRVRRVCDSLKLQATDQAAMFDELVVRTCCRYQLNRLIKKENSYS